MFAPNFEAIRHVTLVLEPKNLPTSVAQKAVSVKNGLTPQKIFDMVDILRYPFIPTSPLLATMRFFPFFFPFFSS